MATQVVEAEAVSTSAVTIRLLPPEEFEKLRQIPPFDKLGELPNPVSNWPVVAETPDGAIVGFWFVYLAPHVEPLWLAPQYRGRSGILRKLWRGVYDVLKARGWVTAYGVILDDNIPTGLLGQAKRLGFQPVETGKLYYVNVDQGTLRSSVDRTMGTADDDFSLVEGVGATPEGSGGN